MSHAWAAIVAVLVLLCGCAEHDRKPLAVERAAAPDCPNTMGSTAGLVIGCTNRANLRAMVADQADLDHGHALSPASGTQEARGVEAYKLGKVKNLPAGNQSQSSTPAPTPAAPK